MKKVKISAPNKDKLQELINNYFYSKFYVITDDNKVFNTTKNDYLDYHYQIRISRGRYQLVYDSTDRRC